MPPVISRSISTASDFNCIPLLTDHAWSVFCSQGCSAYLGRAVIVVCSHLLIVSLRDSSLQQISCDCGTHVSHKPNMQLSGYHLRSVHCTIHLKGRVNTLSSNITGRVLFTCIELLPCKVSTFNHNSPANQSPLRAITGNSLALC